jgi:thioredoxin reductase
LYTARAKLKTIVLTGNHLGGQLSDVRQIENWPGKVKASGKETIEDLIEQAKSFGALLIRDNAQSIDLSTWPFVVKTVEGKQLNALAVIIATGRIAKRLNVPGVEAYWGRGVGTCTICDAPFHKNQDVSVVGGGDTAADRALQLAPFASKVYMIVRDAALDASGVVQDYVKNNQKIHILYNTELREIKGDQEGMNEIIVFDNKTKKQYAILAKGLYFAIGYHPNSELVKKMIKTDNEGFIWTDGKTQHTSINGIFAAGDVADRHYGKAGVATGAGVKAGMDAIEFLQNIGFTFDVEKKFSAHLYHHQKPSKAAIEPVDDYQVLKKIIAEATVPVVLDFYTDYCPTCKTLLSYLKLFAAEHEKDIKIIQVNYDKAPELVKEFNVPAVPYFVAIKDKKVVQQKKIGTKKELEELVKSLIKSE